VKPCEGQRGATAQSHGREQRASSSRLADTLSRLAAKLDGDNSPGRGSRVSLAEGLPACDICVQDQDALAASASRKIGDNRDSCARERAYLF